MPKRTSKKPTDDVNIIATRIVGAVTAPAKPPSKEKPRKKNPAAVALGRLGGKKGGPARAQKLSPQKRREIAKQAALSRWESKKKSR